MIRLPTSTVPQRHSRIRALKASVICSGVILASIAILAEDGVTIASQPGNWDLYPSIHAGVEDDLYISLWRGFSTGRISHISTDGQQLGAWDTDGGMKDLAVSPTGDVLSAMAKSSRVYHFDPNGEPQGWWQARYYVYRIASGMKGPVGRASIYALWSPLGPDDPSIEQSWISRYGLEGEKLAEWEVESTAQDVAVVGANDEWGEIVQVASVSGISRYLPNGTLIERWPIVVGSKWRMATGPARNTYIAIEGESGEPGELWRYDEAGRGTMLCSLPGSPLIDLSILATSGDAFVLFEDFILGVDRDCEEVARISKSQVIENPTVTLAATRSPEPSETPHSPVCASCMLWLPACSTY